MATVSMMAYNTRPAFGSYTQSYDPLANWSSTSTFSPAFGRQSQTTSSTSPSSLQRYQISSASTSQVASRPSTAESETKPSLPSISNLLGIADRNREPHYRAQQPSITSHPTYPLSIDKATRADPIVDRTPRSVGTIFDRPAPYVDNLPPTPPRSDAGYTSNAHNTSLPLNPPFVQTSSATTSDSRPTNIALSNSASSIASGPSPSSSPRYTTSPQTSATSTFYSSSPKYQEPSSQMHAASLYAQRPLPVNFPPAPPAALVPAPHASHAGSAHNPWEHHHYISPSSQSTLPQTQDRYVCPACNKAFSRPSSLKIHSHSHTGEKPFKCPHSGCNKAFSVRSNMKRHERGCHAGLSTSLVTPA